MTSGLTYGSSKRSSGRILQDPLDTLRRYQTTTWTRSRVRFPPLLKEKDALRRRVTSGDPSDIFHIVSFSPMAAHAVMIVARGCGRTSLSRGFVSERLDTCWSGGVDDQGWESPEVASLGIGSRAHPEHRVPRDSPRKGDRTTKTGGNLAEPTGKDLLSMVADGHVARRTRTGSGSNRSSPRGCVRSQYHV